MVAFGAFLWSEFSVKRRSVTSSSNALMAVLERHIDVQARNRCTSGGALIRPWSEPQFGFDDRPNNDVLY